MSEFIVETEEFNIRKVMDADYEAIGKIAAAEYLFGRMYKIDMDVLELAIVIVNDYQGKGYGEKIIRAWVSWVHETMGYCGINIKIDSQNCRSLRLFQKIGAIVDYDGSKVECHISL